MLIFNISLQESGQSLFNFLRKRIKKVPLTRIHKSLRQKDIKVNNPAIKDRNYIVKVNDQIKVFNLIDAFDTNSTSGPNLSSIKITFKVIYEDSNILIVDKPINVAVHDNYNCLNNQVLKYLELPIQPTFNPVAINRLDKTTSGVIVYAKNYPTLIEMQKKQIDFDKIYAFKSFLSESKHVTIKLAHNNVLKKMVVHSKGKEATTEFNVTEDIKTAKLITGRKHQIRATLAFLGVPILGDIKYGGKKANRVYLHAMSLTFNNLDSPLAYLNNKTFTSSLP